MNKPNQIQIYPKIDLKLGIKSSLPHIKAVVGLFLLLWEANDRPAELIYSQETTDNLIELSDACYASILSYTADILGVNADMKILYENNLFKSQIEALNVATELFWGIGSIRFLDDSLNLSSERTGGRRYLKKIIYSSNVDLIHIAFEGNITEYKKVLLNWCGFDIYIDEELEDRLIKMLTIFSELCIFKLSDNNEDIIFNQSSIYSKLLEHNSSVSLVSDKEPKGAFRILKNVLGESLNFALTYNRSQDVQSSLNLPELANYKNRVDKYLSLCRLLEFNELDSSTNNIVNQIEDVKENRMFQLPHQRIFFGAPGTGKSYKLNQAAEEHFAGHYARVTFHPNYMYGNFVGQYKPYPAEDNPEKITYRFVPGVLLNQLVEALKNPEENYLVIIEEINRANVAAVFGDLFQLLDRDGTGNSEYSISTTKEVQDYLKNEAFKYISLDANVQTRLGEEFSNLYLPNNLFIWATMNSADQGVMPMDTAFKRRWEFEYTGVNEISKSDRGRFESYYFEMSSGAKYSWNEYREAVNAKLSKLNIAEDKLLGPYFITKSILESDDKKHITAVIKNKVLMYLYEDAAKAYRGKLFAEGTYGTYSQLCSAFDNNPLTIFVEPINIYDVESKVSRNEEDGD